MQLVFAGVVEGEERRISAKKVERAARNPSPVGS